jgi:adenosine deaminase
MYEDHPYELLKTMADKGVLVEINLTSNDVILGVRGNKHPFATYRKFGVPVALSTDDPGIERIDITHDYARAVTDYALTYADLKELVRNSIEYSFIPGASLWADKGGYARFAADCGGAMSDAREPSPACAAFLAANAKAAQQWELERRFQAFEAGF